MFKSILSEEISHCLKNRVFYKYIITAARFLKSPSENINNWIIYLRIKAGKENKNFSNKEVIGRENNFMEKKSFSTKIVI